MRPSIRNLTIVLLGVQWSMYSKEYNGFKYIFQRKKICEIARPKSVFESAKIFAILAWFNFKPISKSILNMILIIFGQIVLGLQGFSWIWDSVSPVYSPFQFHKFFFNFWKLFETIVLLGVQWPLYSLEYNGLFLNI